MSKSNGSQNWLLGSMSRGMRRIATAMSALTLVVSLVFAGLLYHVGTAPIPLRAGLVVTADASVGNKDLVAPQEPGDAPDGTEQISDEDVPLAAPVANKSPQTPMVTVALGFGLGAIVVFFARHIYRVNASIDAMSRRRR